MKRLILIAVRNIQSNTRRTVLLGGAIGAVTALLVLLTSVSNGIQTTMLEAATTLSTGHVNVAGFFKITSGQAAPAVTNYAPLKKLVEGNVPEADIVVDRMRGWGKVVSPQSSIQVGIGGVDITTEKGFHDVLEITKGSLDDLKRPDGALIFESQAKRLKVKLKDGLTLSAPSVRGANMAEDVTVVAIAKDIGFLSGFSIFVNKEKVRKLYGMGDTTTGAIQIYLKDHADSKKVAARLRKLLTDHPEHTVMDLLSQPFWMKFPVVTREAWVGQRIDITTWEDELKFLTWTVQAFDSLTVALVSVLLIIIVVGVMNSLWMAIRERTKEIGTLRAIGMGRGRVLSMFVIEAFILSLGATVVGALAGWGLCEVLNAVEIPISKGFQIFLMRDTLFLVVEGRSIALAIGVITSVVTLFSLYPAYRAARMPPITAIHHVG